MNKRGPKTPEEREAKIKAARDLRAAGWSFSAIGRILGVTRSAVHRWLDDNFAKKIYDKNIEGRERRRSRKSEVDPPPRRPLPAPPASQDVDRDILDLRRRGYSKSAIAAMLRVPHRKVEEVLG